MLNSFDHFLTTIMDSYAHNSGVAAGEKSTARQEDHCS